MPVEAQRLAAELWRDRPGEGDGSPLVVDIASSRRRYGRLAEFPPPRRPPSALGVAAATSSRRLRRHRPRHLQRLADAKRSDATARTLLSFSESLSGVTTLAELVQLLADTVPAVTNCDQSTVYLWDSEPASWSPGRAPRASRHPTPTTDRSSLSGRPRASTEGPMGRRAALDAGGADARHRRPPDHPNRRRRGRADAAASREVMVLDGDHRRPLPGQPAAALGNGRSVVAPLFAAGEFLGVIAANFGTTTPTASIHDPDLHERLSGSGRPGRHCRAEPRAAGEGLAHGLARRPHRPAQPTALRGPGGTGAGPLPPGRRAGLHVLRRPRPLQDRQRHPGPRAGRRPDPPGQPAAGGDDPGPGHGGPGRGRRIRHPPAGPGRPAGHRSTRPALPRGAERPLRGLRPGRGDLGLHRNRHGPRARRHLRRAAQPGRRGHVPGQGPGPQRLPDVLGVTGQLGPGTPGRRRGDALRRPGACPRA